MTKVRGRIGLLVLAAASLVSGAAYADEAKSCSQLAKLVGYVDKALTKLDEGRAPDSVDLGLIKINAKMAVMEFGRLGGGWPDDATITAATELIKVYGDNDGVVLTLEEAIELLREKGAALAFGLQSGCADYELPQRYLELSEGVGE